MEMGLNKISCGILYAVKQPFFYLVGRNILYWPKVIRTASQKDLVIDKILSYDMHIQDEINNR